MDDYVRRSDILNRLCDRLCYSDPMDCQYKIRHKGTQYCSVAAAMLDIPAADVRPVVLCKDCKHYDAATEVKCVHILGIMEPDEDDFCSHGERREADHDQR